MRHWLLTKTSILFSGKKRKIKSSLWLHRPKEAQEFHFDMQFIEIFIKLILKTRLDLQFQKIILNKAFGQSENKLTDELFLIRI